jgi:transposase-like protein
MTKPKRYKRYSAEFKREAILRATEEGITDKAVCDELGISTRQFRRWRDELEMAEQTAANRPLSSKAEPPQQSSFGVLSSRMIAARRVIPRH